MHAVPKFDEIKELIQLARREDLSSDDVTSRLMIDEECGGRGDVDAERSGDVRGAADCWK